MKLKKVLFNYLLCFIFVSLSNASLDYTQQISVTFSPSQNQGYLSEIISVIDKSVEKIDIALYGFESIGIYNSLKRAANRGVSIRMLYEGALKDRKKDDYTVSHFIEDIGIDVRYVNKTNHHKFLISDNNFLVTSSGNWNYKANSIYDENTLWVNDVELVLRYRSEFEYLWNNSREFGLTFSSISYDSDSLLSLIIDNSAIDVVFTSSNYRTYNSSTYGPTFAKVSGNQNAADKLVELINNAQQSISIAVAHFRSRPIAEALIAKKDNDPDINIRVYLDGQEYVSEEYNYYQIVKQEDCLAQASTPAQTRDCLEKNFYYSYELINAGIDVRFKYYSYKWDHTTSEMMHHKYAVFDDEIIATGSYNYSYNAETNSMENLLIFDVSVSPNTVLSYVHNFNSIWNTGRIEGYYNDIISDIGSDNRYVPVLFPSMALDYQEIRTLKQDIENKCPAVLDQYFKDNRKYFLTFPSGFDITYDSQERPDSVYDRDQQEFNITYSYNNGDKFTEVLLQTKDSLQYLESYLYNDNGNLSNMTLPQYSIDFIYRPDGSLEGLDAGQGIHSWVETENDSGKLSYYSTPSYQDYIIAQFDSIGLPITVTDADNRSVQWEHDSNSIISSIESGNHFIDYSYDDSLKEYEIESSGNENILIKHQSTDSLHIALDGTVQADVQYVVTELPDKYTQFDISITSNHVLSGTGRQRNFDYLLNPYGHVVQSGDVNILREPFSGNIVEISCNGIVETRSYNNWELLDTQHVEYDGQIYYEAVYGYDGLHRIKSLQENILGTTSSYNYSYNLAGQLETVYKDGIITEEYSYDSFGNRQIAITNDNYTYSYDINRLSEYSWQLSDRINKVEFTYNNSGQLQHTQKRTIKKNNNNWVSSERDYSYNVFGDLNSVTWASQTQEYRYDPYNRQIATIQNGSVKNSLIYGLSGSPLARLNENGRITDVFIYADKNTPIVMSKGNIEYYLISDIRGSIKMVVKSTTGGIRQQIFYDSFGKIIADSNPGYTPFGYAGGLYDSRTDLIRFGARDYFPEIGRWTSEDPIGFFSGDVNFYAYVGNDPINYIDLNGLSKSGAQSRTLVPDYSPNDGALGSWGRTTLRPGTEIDRFGAINGKYFSPRGTPLDMRALPSTTQLNQYRVFKVVKPFEVKFSTIAPTIRKIGLGKQYLSPVSAEVLWNRGIITKIVE